MSEDFARLGARLLASHLRERKPSALERDQGIAIVARAIGERARRRRRTRLLTFGAALSAAAAVAVAAGFVGARQAASTDALACAPRRTCASTAFSATPVGLVDGHRFEPGQRVEATKDGPTLVEFGAAARVALDARSELEYRQGDSTRRFGLMRGAIHLRVGKLAPGQRFLVETPDAEVEVRGTAFHVSLTEPGQGCAAPRTRVAVDEGVVEVRYRGVSYRISPGEHWPTHCEEPSAPQELAVAPEPPRPSMKEWQTKTAHRVATLSGDSTSDTSKREQEPAQQVSADVASALSEQNNLYAKAVTARRAGRLGESLAAYDQLLARFPNSALAESAQGERLRLVMRLQPRSAKTEAAHYLARYPRGLASVEARALLSTP